MPNLVLGAGGAAAEAYTIDQSLRFDDGDSAYLNRDPGSAGNRRTFTLSMWFKRGNISGSHYRLFNAYESDNDRVELYFDTTNDNLSFEIVDGGVATILKTSQLFRDPSAWYHLVYAVDTTQSTDTDRVNIYVNGSQVTAFDTTQYPAENADTAVNFTVEQVIGRTEYGGGGNYYDGYMAEVYLIDGLQYAASDFGETDSATNQWKPIDASGLTFGTNGFYQKYGSTESITSFKDSSSNDETITGAGTTTNTTAEKKVGSTSIYVPTSNSNYLSIPGIDFGSDDFTIEYWAKDVSGGAMGFFNSNYGGPGHGWYFDNSSGDATQFYSVFDSSGESYDGTHDWANWTNVAIVRDGTSLVVYLDGSSWYTRTISGAMGSSGAIRFGRNGTDTSDGSGYFDEIRISDNVRYTGTFTPSTTAFTSDANTLILISDWTFGFGEDSSGNGNNFTPTNLVATDQMKDSPTNNFCTMDPVDKLTVTLSEGNLQVSGGSGGQEVRGTIAKDTGKWYYEMYLEARPSASDQVIVGVGNIAPTAIGSVYAESVAYRTDANKYVFSGTQSSYGATWTAGDIIGVAMNLEDEEVTFYKDNSTQGAISFTLGTNVLTPFCRTGASSGTDELIFNFGQDSSFAGNKTAGGNADSNGVGDFFYAPPTDYLALCTSNLDTPSIKKSGDNFNTVLYTGDGATTQAVTGVGFSPGFLWIKSRDSGAHDPLLVDVVRGANTFLVSSDRGAERGDSTYVSSLDSDGFTVGDDPFVNADTENYVSWNWKAGTSFDPATAGSVTGSGSSDSTAGFSIVKWTHISGAQTIGHGLSEVPQLILVKDIDSGGAGYEWWVQALDIMGNTKYMHLNNTDVESSSNDPWNDTSPTASVFTYNEATTDDFIAYCFHSIEGYSKVGSYEGNANADGTFVYTGFRPAYVLFKRTSGGVGLWMIKDSARSPYNPAEASLAANSADAETDEADVDFVSNGFKLRTTEPLMNAANPILYLAFAEFPFKYANAR